MAQTSEKFSIAEVVALSGSAKRGDVVISTSPLPSIEYADTWKKPRRGNF